MELVLSSCDVFGTNSAPFSLAFVILFLLFPFLLTRQWRMEIGDTTQNTHIVHNQPAHERSNGHNALLAYYYRLRVVTDTFASYRYSERYSHHSHRLTLSEPKNESSLPTKRSIRLDRLSPRSRLLPRHSSGGLYASRRRHWRSTISCSRQLH